MKKLKSLVLLIFCLQLILPSIVEGFLRFPILVTHYFHHNHGHEKINIINFITAHYSEKHHDETHGEHENLPFHNHLDTALNLISALNSDILELKLHTAITFQEPKKITSKQNHFDSNVSINIWKPPKFS